jgi:hypothetical protein
VLLALGHFSTFDVSLKTETSSLHSEAQHDDVSVSCFIT